MTVHMDNLFKGQAFYFLNFSIGTPAQRFTAVINFFVPYTRVIDVSYGTGNCCPQYCSNEVFCKYTCSPRCCGEFNATSPSTAHCSFYFDGHLSSTYVKNGSWFFQDESSCEMGAICGRGFAGIDTVGLIAGQALVEDVLFGQLNDLIYVRISESLEPVAQLGLGPASWGIDDRLIGQEPVLFKLAKQSNFSTLFSLWIPRTNLTAGVLIGEISYGSVNDLKCGTPQYYNALSIVGNQNSDHGQGYVMPLNALGWSTYLLALPDGQHFNLSLAPIDARPIVIGSQIVLDAMLKAVGAKVTDDGTILMDCDTIPPIDFTLNGILYRVPADRFSEPYWYGAPKQCQVHIHVASGLWQLGAHFLQEFCLVVDFDNNRVGLSNNLIGLLP